MKSISVIVPCFNEEKYINSCIESILAQDYPHEKMEILIVDGMSTDNTRLIISNYSNKYPIIKVIDNIERYVPFGLNTGIKASTGEIIIRMDTHCIYPKDYFSILVKNLISLNADNVGGVWNILPFKNSIVGKSIAIGISHKFGTGNALYKSTVKEIVEVDTVPFGCFKRELFERIGFFDNDLLRDQDDEFNARIIKNGGKIYLIPTLIINYYARDTLLKMTKMFYQYGLFKPLVNRKLGFIISFRQIFPALFALGLIIGMGLSIFSVLGFLLYVSILIIYILISLVYSFIEAIKHKNFGIFLLLPFVFFLIHISYGLGYIVGIFKFIVLNEKNIFVNSSR